MNFKDLNLSSSYISCGEENISDSFIIPALKVSKVYDRCTGFFSSNVLITILDGVVELSRNKGRIRLLTSPNLSEDDIEAIKIGYESREKFIIDHMTQDTRMELEKLNNDQLQLLSELIATGVLDIKIILMKGLGIYHDKLGIMEDFEGNKIVFFGSANSSWNAYKNNYEKIRLSFSWNESELKRIDNEIYEFECLWEGSNDYVETYEFKDSLRSNIIKILKKRGHSRKEPIDLYDYQKEAIKAWKENSYHGFYVMATGTGKTWTAIYSIKELLKVDNIITIIAVPYKHLINQWTEDIVRAIDVRIVKVSSENYGWEKFLSDEIIRSKFEQKKPLIILTTIASFSLARFQKIVLRSRQNKLLVVDEAHRFTSRNKNLIDQFKYMLGLSATPGNGKDLDTSNDLLSFFGGKVFDLPIEKALADGFLVQYCYEPIYVNLSDEEEQSFQALTNHMMSCFKNDILIDQSKYISLYRARQRIISMAQAKIDQISEIFSHVKEKNHLVVYCGDGKLFYDIEEQEIRHIQFIKRILTNLGYKVSQFTAKEDMEERIEIVDSFNKGEIDALAAIRCLDEGINIPSINSALILASNDDYREFVQRRGRILRKYEGKEITHIYDVIALPSYNGKNIAKIEFRRFYEYAHLAINKDALLKELSVYFKKYSLELEDVLFNSKQSESEI